MRAVHMKTMATMKRVLNLFAGNFLSLTAFDSVFIVLLTVVSFSWFSAVDYTFFDEPVRDYFVSHHIVAYGEFPLAGPLNGVSGILKNSPVYNYFLAFFLFIKDDFLFLQTINIFSIIVSVALLHNIAKRVFDAQAALLAALFFIGFIDVVYAAFTHFVSQTYIMLLFFLVSILLLIIAAQKNNYVLVPLSVFFFALAGVMHNSVLALAPIFLVVVLAVMKRQKKSFWHHTLAIMVFPASLGLFYFPIILYALSAGLSFWSLVSSSGIYASGLEEFATHIWRHATVLFNALTGRTHGIFPFLRMAILIYAVLLFPARIYEEKEPIKKIFFMVALASAATMIIAASPFWRLFDVWEFLPALTLLFIAAAGALTSFLRDYLVPGKVLNMIFILALGFFFSAKAGFAGNFSAGSMPNYRESITITKAIQTAVLEIQKRNLFGDFSFFQLRVYDGRRGGGAFRRDDAAYLMPVVKALDVKVTAINDRALGGYWYTSSDRYIFLVCENFMDESCVGAFLKDSTAPYEARGEVYAGPQRSVSVFEKSEIGPMY